jgi:hypothetical protein
MSSKNLRLLSAVFGRRDGADEPAAFDDLREQAEAAAAEALADVSDDQGIAEVGLVVAILQHGLAIRDAREGAFGDRAAVGEFAEHAGQYRLDRVEHVVLCDEAHLEVELVEFAGAAVGAGVLVAEAGGDLEIAVEAGDHQQLLEHLRRLGERIEFAWMHAAGHQIIASAFGAAGGQDRSLELGEALFHHPPPNGGDHVRAEHDVGVQPLAPEVEVAILKADVLGIVLLARDRQRQFGGGALHRHAPCEHLDFAGRQVGVGRALGARLHHAVDRNDALDPQTVEDRKRGAVGVRNDLGDAVVVAKIDEQHAAMVALAVDPAGQADVLADVLGA